MPDDATLTTLPPLIRALSTRLVESGVATEDAVAQGVASVQRWRKNGKGDGGTRLRKKSYDLVRATWNGWEGLNGSHAELREVVEHKLFDDPRIADAHVTKIVEAASARIEQAESLLGALKGLADHPAEAPVRERMLALAAQLVEATDDVAETRRRLDADVVLQRALVEALNPVQVAQRDVSGASLTARGRAGAAAPKPGQPGSPDFEKLHPRGRGGKWIGKGEGTKGEPSQRVKQLQERLNQLGFRLTQDGAFQGLTEEAVKAFQRKYGLRETGKVDATTVEAMRNPPPLSAKQVASQVNPKPKTKGKGSRAGKGTRGGSGTQVALGPDGKPVTVSGVSSGSSLANSKSAGPLRRGDGMMGAAASADVSALQNDLTTLGYDLGKGGSDGKYGQSTEEAVRALQEKYGLRVDGVVGPRTIELIQRLLKRQKGAAKESPLSADQLAEATEEAHDMGIEEASYSGNAIDAGGNVAGTPQPYGGIAGLFPATATQRKRWNGSEDLFGLNWPTMPPNLRESGERNFPRCATCVHFDGGKICTLYSAGVDNDDLCDSWFTLTSPEAQRFAYRVIGTDSEFDRVTEAGDTVGVATLRHQRHKLIDELGALIEDDPLGRARIRSEALILLESGEKPDVARAAARVIVARRVIDEVRNGVHGYAIPEGSGEAEGFDGAYWLNEATFTAEKRRKLAGKGQALPGGSFPIENKAQLSDAIKAFGRAKDKPSAKAHIVKRAKALGATDMLPSGWLQESEVLVPVIEGIDEALLDFLDLDEAADSMAKATKHEEVGHTGQGLWKHKGLQLPAYIQHIANDIKEKRGLDTSRAIAIAIGAVKRWARGGGKVDAGTRAAAQKALAEWERLKATHGGKKLREAARAENLDDTLVDLLEMPPVLVLADAVESAAPDYIDRLAHHLHFRRGEHPADALAHAVVYARKLHALNVEEAGVAVRDWDAAQSGVQYADSMRLIEACDPTAFYPSEDEALALVAEMELYEAAHPLSVHFDPRMHPRDRRGEFRQVLNAIMHANRGSEATLPGGVSVTRGRGGKHLTVRAAGKTLTRTSDTSKAAKVAFQSAGIDERGDRNFGIRTARYNVAFDPGDVTPGGWEASPKGKELHTWSRTLPNGRQEMLMHHPKRGTWSRMQMTKRGRMDNVEGLRPEQAHGLLQGSSDYVRLQGYGMAPAKRAGDFKAGEHRLYNYGESNPVKKVEHSGNWVHITVAGKDGKDYTTRHNKDTLLGHAVSVSMADPGETRYGQGTTARFGRARQETPPGSAEHFAKIGWGDKVTILTPHGQKRSGRATLKGPHGWVLNAGGAHGTPIIADERNTVSVSKRVTADDPGTGSRSSRFTGAKRQALVARRVSKGNNEEQSVAMLDDLVRTSGSRDNLAAALHYQGFSTQAGAEKDADALLGEQTSMSDPGSWLNDPAIKRQAAREDKRDALWREHNGKSATIDGRPATIHGRNDGFMDVHTGDGYSATYAPETVDHVVKNKGGKFTGGSKHDPLRMGDPGTATESLDAMRRRRDALPPSSPEHVALTREIAARAGREAKLPPRAERAQNEMAAKHRQAIEDWNSGRAYLGNDGNYRLKDGGKIAPWNSKLKADFPTRSAGSKKNDLGTDAFHRLASRGSVSMGDPGTATLPNASELKHMSDSQIKDLTDRYVQDQSVDGEFRRRLATEANKRATRRYQGGGGDDVEAAGTAKPTLTSSFTYGTGTPGFSSRGGETPKGRASLQLRSIPEDWLIEHGYAVKTHHPERTQTYGNANSGLGRKTAAYDSLDFKNNLDVERVWMHYLTGKVPKNPPEGSNAAAQFRYSGKGGTKATRAALARRLTEASVSALGVVLGMTDGHELLANQLSLIESDSLAMVRLPVAEFIVEARKDENDLVGAVADVLQGRLRAAAPDVPAKLQEARDAGDTARVALYTALGSALE